MGILTGLPEGFINSALYDVAKKILKKDPITSALDQTIDELTREKQNGWYELREIDRNQKEIFKNINIIEEATFFKIVIDNGVLPETASRLFKNFSEKFNEIINEAAKKEPEVFFPYVIREFERNKTNNEELVKLLTGFAQKNEVYLDRIIKHFKELEKTPYIPDIQSVLRKEETTEGAFFKNEPEWVDFEQGYIVERKEVSEIIKNLEIQKVQLILGKPASGKSVILKNVGFKIAKENKKIYILELKKHQGEDVKLYFEAIPEINEDNPIFIVDDAHLYPSECERLIRDFKSGGKGKLIIGSRPTEDILPTHPKKTSEFQFLNKTEIHAEDVIHEMMKTFLKKQHNFGDDRIETVSKNLHKYKDDLWQLSWALKAYSPEKETVNNHEIYENIIVSIREIETKDKKTISAEDAFLPLSIFFSYEIPIEREYLEEELEIKEDIINQLIKISEVIETREKGNRMLSLNHSSSAKLYLGAYKKYDAFGKKIKKNILNGRDEDDLEYCMFYKYIAPTNPRNAIDVVISLDRDFSNEKGGRTLLKKLVEIDKIQISIEKGIEKEEDLEKIGHCVSNIAFVSEETGLKLADSVSFKIDREEDLTKVGKCVRDIARISKDVAKKLVDSVSAKIDKEEDIQEVGSCIMHIASARKEVALKLVDRVNIDAMSSKIDKEEDISIVGECVLAISKANKDAAMKLVDSIDIDVLSSKIDKGELIFNISSCLSAIARTSTDVALKLVDSVSAEMDKEEDIEKVYMCVFYIAIVNKEVANEIVNRLNPKLRDEMKQNIPYLKT